MKSSSMNGIDTFLSLVLFDIDHEMVIGTQRDCHSMRMDGQNTELPNLFIRMNSKNSIPPYRMRYAQIE